MADDATVRAAGYDRTEYSAAAGEPSAFYYDYDDDLPQVWVRGEYLMWFTRGNSLPPLLTTSPDFTPRADAGVLDTPTTSLRFGGEKVDENFRPGGRLRAGYRLDDVAPCYLELDFFGVGDGANTNFATPLSAGLPILARPIFNTQTGQEDAQLIAYPGLVDGQFMARTSSELFSSAFILRRNVAESANVR
ncbi:MAG TPA: BBP7 family outer membrane beta-barrel protein, partial [Pirellulaceae bacterium]|nr:BBP7 family outer membrane beta-barrel protein [Pirellulaceae bacterium]